jgi:general L-amino acid transport system permease protein
MQKLWRNRQLRNLSLQAMALAGLAAILGFAGFNAVTNLQNSGVTSGFGFLSERAGYDINFSLVDYSSRTATHTYAWLVGTLNTVFFAAVTIVTATLCGLALAMARLSPNWLLSVTSRVALEYLRNVPVLVHIFIWYGIFLALPSVRQAIPVFDIAFLSNRGFVMPAALAIRPTGHFDLCRTCPRPTGRHSSPPAPPRQISASFGRHQRLGRPHLCRNPRVRGARVIYLS